MLMRPRSGSHRDDGNLNSSVFVQKVTKKLNEAPVISVQKTIDG